MKANAMPRSLAIIVAAVTSAAPVVLAEGISLARIPHIHEITVDPAAPDHLILATPKGLYRLTPDIRMLPLLDKDHDATGRVVSDNGKHMLVSGRKNSEPFGVMISGNAGKTWQPQSITADNMPA